MEEILKKQRDFYLTGTTRNPHFIKQSLINFKKVLKNHETDFNKAIYLDLNKCETEAYSCEIAVVYEELNYHIKHVLKNLKVKKVKTSIANMISKSYIIKEPYGNSLIIATWNYPIQLSLVPLVASIACGNTVVLKTSEYVPNVSKVLNQVIKEAFNPEYVTTIGGHREELNKLLELPFNYYFFTGSTNVGKIVMRAAASNLAGVTLELGGKSPCIVDASANIKLSAKRIAWGKFTNSGQTCVAPDHIYVHASVKDELIKELNIAISNMYLGDPLNNNEYGKVISKKHFDRLLSYVSYMNLVNGVDYDENTLKIRPIVESDATEESLSMKEEIFGPILPVITYTSEAELINLLQSKPRSLALYIFSHNKKFINLIHQSVSFGGGAVNDTLMHLVSTTMPFGGVGESGVGQYHGKYSVDTFTHPKSILSKSTKFDNPLRYPPYKNHLKTIKKLLK
jgi:aldehyde dehydrogenase (NAD+)